MCTELPRRKDNTYKYTQIKHSNIHLLANTLHDIISLLLHFTVLKQERNDVS